MGGRGQSSMSARSKTSMNADDIFLNKLSPHERSYTEYVMGLTGLGAKEANECEKAVWGWSGSDYKDVRKYQKGIDGYDSYKEQAENIERFLKLAPKWGTSGDTYRGVKMSKEDFSKLAKGVEVDMHGTSSWSTSRGVAEGFAPSISDLVSVLYISPSQSKGVDIHTMAHYPSEREVLVSKGARYRVKKKPKRVQGKWVVELEEIQ